MHTTRTLVSHCLLLAAVIPAGCLGEAPSLDDGRELGPPLAGAGGGSLLDPSAGALPTSLLCDDAATCCPTGLIAVMGTAGNDIVTSATANRCHVSLGGADQITDTSPVGGRNAVLAGVGDDSVVGGYGPGILSGGTGLDTIYGRGSNDVLKGGADADNLYGSGGNDTIEGEAGDDTINGGSGNDAIVGGAGMDWINASSNDDTVIVRDACELVAGEQLHGSTGNDVLVLPMTQAAAEALGVTITGFEKVVVIDEDPYFDCGAQCECPSLPLPPDPDVCDFTGMADPTDQATLESLCLDAIDDVGPALLWTLPNAPLAADIDDFMADYHSAHPAMVPGLSSLGYIASGPADPQPAVLPPGAPQPGVDTTETPCDLPTQPLDVGIGIGGSHDNCSEAETAILTEDVERAKFQVWRARQAIQAVVDAEATPAVAEALWNQGTDELSAAWWFGEYDPTRAEIVLATLDDVWTTLHGNWAGGSRMNIQCWHPFTWWETVLIGLFAPDRMIAKYLMNPCWYSSLGTKDSRAHTVFTWNPEWTAARFLYPVWSFEVCENYFDTVDVPDRAALLVHEMLHHKFNDAGLIKDNHDATGVCGDGNDPCYGDGNAHDLAVAFPEEAIINNSNYQSYVRWIGRAYTEGLCDLTNNTLCFPSECCGNGVREPDEGEMCDGRDFGRQSCFDYGFVEGELVCSSDCQSVDPGLCHSQCGNDILEPGDPFEQCDGTDFGGLSCGSYGYENGSLLCTSTCSISTDGCSGGVTHSPPPSYAGCEVTLEDCNGDPAQCHLAGGAGDCLGGPCVRTNPSNRVAGQQDPFSDFHPKGDFRDQQGNLYRCNDIDGVGETTCVDDDGWGVCKACGLGPDETMLGCSCNDDDDCGLDLSCWGGEFPNGGFCWPDSGPPEFQCEQGACGQSIRDEDFSAPEAEDGAGYCEHYSNSGVASCQPERCNDLQAQICAGAGLVCKLAFGDAECTVECFSDADCQLPGWPVGMHCGALDRCTY